MGSSPIACRRDWVGGVRAGTSARQLGGWQVVKLEDFLDHPIDDICGNGYVDHTSNHCAHFVSHALGFQFGMNCRKLTDGSSRAANIRVHELFSRCGSVGLWPPPAFEPVLIFVTAADHVDLAHKTMHNVPNKHVGVFTGGLVYHYSNAKGKVVRQGVAEFQAHFDKAYGKPQGYFYGTPPGQPATAEATPARLEPIVIVIDRQGENVFGHADGEEFYVATITEAFHGGLIQPDRRRYGPVFKASDWECRIGHWANVLELIGHCESSNYFNAVNTCDRARFCFGFCQFAAHTPGDNLILLLRACTRLPAAARYLPELKLIEGKLNVVENGRPRSVERVGKIDGEDQLVELMSLLNPTQPDIDDAELAYAARLVHWSNSDPELRALQVEIAADILQRRVIERYDPRLDLDGRSDVEVALVADILHQGRATYKEIAEALQRTDVDALIDINPAPAYAVRQRQAREKLRRLVKAKRLGRLRFSRAEGGFTDPKGPAA
jgi:hypothetical protein